MKATREIIEVLLDCIDEPMTDEDVNQELEDSGVDVQAFLANVRAKVQN